MTRSLVSCALLLCAVGCEQTSSDADDGAIIDATLEDGAVEVDAAAEADSGLPEADAGEDTYSANLNLPSEPFNYTELDLPAHFGVETLGYHGQRRVIAEDNTPFGNTTTDHGATLGRVLFYDTNLSHNRTVSCASCHKAEHGFSDDRVLSLGFMGGETGRHSMGLTNARYFGAGQFFWDLRAETLEEQVLMPFQDEVEMGMTLEGLVERVAQGDYYAELFENAFGDPEVTPERISKAIAQFVRSLVSSTSKYDQGRAMVERRDDPFPNFTAEENQGKALFVNPPPLGGMACFICHQGEAFIAVEATNNGLDADASLDRGYGGVTGATADMTKFKVPSLRNVAVRAPYMHDGRFDTLEEVIEHYNSGIQPNPNLGAPFGVQNGQATRLNLSPAQKAALVAFLKTLTDTEMLEDPKFSDPFER